MARYDKQMVFDRILESMYSGKEGDDGEKWDIMDTVYDIIGMIDGAIALEYDIYDRLQEIKQDLATATYWHLLKSYEAATADRPYEVASDIDWPKRKENSNG